MSSCIWCGCSDCECINNISDARDKIIELEEKLDKAKKALEFYADHTSWRYPGDDFHNFIIANSDVDHPFKNTKIDKCGGKLARQTLMEIGG